MHFPLKSSLNPTYNSIYYDKPVSFFGNNIILYYISAFKSKPNHYDEGRTPRIDSRNPN